MSDLISRSELHNLPRYNFGVSMLTSEEYIKVSDIKKILTAYSVDKVVEELRTDSSVKLYGSNNSGNYLIPVNRAIEIVKQGGVADECVRVEEIENMYGKETDLTEEIRLFIDKECEQNE